MDSFRNISLTIDLSTSERNKLAAAQSQEKQLDDYWSEFGSIIGREVNKINSTLLSLQSKKENLTLEKQQYASAKANITHRLNEVQFPVGKIPLGINEAISLFPFGLIAGFVVCTALLCKSIVFRKRYHLDYVRQYDQSYHRTGKMISEELPIWIDPVSALYAQVLKSGVILIPFVIFLLSWSLIVQSWNFNNSAIAESILFGDVQTNRMIFNISNSIVFILFICCYVIIYIEWSNYRDDYLQHKIINSRA
jgi:hypothetical protein